MRKISLFILVLFALTSILSGCGNSTNNTKNAAQNASKSSSNTQQVIKYWYPWGGDSEKWDKWRMSEFEKAHPEYKIEATYVPPDAGISNGKLMAAITGGDVPDLIVTSDYASAYSLATQGAFLSLDEALKSVGFDESNINPVFKDVMKYKGSTYLFPEDTNVNLLFYNKDLFKEAGLDPNNPPKTIDELDSMAKKLTKINGGKIERLGFIPWIDAGDDPYTWGYMFGANFYDVNTNKINLTDGKMAEVLNWEEQYAKLYNPQSIKSFTSGFGGAFSPTHPFMTGKVAMTINGNWFTNALKIYAPNINYGIAPIPAPPGGRYGGSNLGTNVFAIPKGAKNVKGAIEFILFAEQARIEDNNVTTWRSVPSLPAQIKDLTLVKNNDPLYSVVLSIANNSNSGHAALTSVSKQMSDDLRAIRDKVIYTGANPVPLLQDEQQKLQQLVDKNK